MSVSKRDIWTNAVYTEIDRDSEMSSSSIKNSLVNISVSRNHLKLNIILRILMVIVLVGNVTLIPWLRDKQWTDAKLKHCNYNPQWLFIDGSLYLYLQLTTTSWSYNHKLSKRFWEKIPSLLISGIVTGLVALLVFIFEILSILGVLNLISNHRIACLRVSFFQRFNFLFILATLLSWFWCQNAWETMGGLSYGFYVMLGLIVWWFLIKLHYKYFKSRLYQRRIINQLLEN